jgi:hypothetical protein
MIVRIIKNWDWSELERISPNNDLCFNGVRFTTDDIEESDGVLILNFADRDIFIRCNPDLVWLLIQEPYVEGLFDWIIKGHDSYSRIFTHKILEGEKYFAAPPMIPWHINKNYDALVNMKEPTRKEKTLSWVTSSQRIFPGHIKRMKFMDHIKRSGVSIDLYGRGINEIEDKWDALAPYYYTLAIENDSTNDYWTEKIADAFLSYTLPIYYGCTNLEDYFPSDSFVRIDIDKPEDAIEIIKETIQNTDKWQKSLSAIKESREIVLNKYNLLEFFSKKYQKAKVDGVREDIVIRKYKKDVFSKIKNIKRKIIKRYLET